MTVLNLGTDAQHGSYACGTHELYRMDCAEFEALRARAGGHCEACGMAEEDAALGKLVIDHAHEYGLGAVRGLVCSRCNSLLSSAEYNMTPTQRGHTPWLRRYMANAWFMQVAAWARINDGLFGIPDVPGQGFLSRVLRHSGVANGCRRIGSQPTVSVAALPIDGHMTPVVKAVWSVDGGYSITLELKPTATAYKIHRVLAAGPNMPEASHMEIGRAYAAVAKAQGPQAVSR